MLANVSTATVSKVLNKKDQHISDATRNRILEIVKRENYRPNMVAKSLKMKKSNSIGIIVPDITNLFFAEMAKGIEDAAGKLGYSVILCNSDNNSDKEEKYLNILQEKMVDGIILTSSDNEMSTYMKVNKVPVIFLDRNIDADGNFARIMIDNKEAGYTATKHLIDKGCKKIGFISSNNKKYASFDRFIGYKNALLDNGHDVDEKLIYLGDFSIENGYHSSMELIKTNDLDGVFCGNDYIAIGVINALRENNIRIPEEVKVVGFDDISILRYMKPSITTIRQPIYEMGKEAVNILNSILEKKDATMTKILKTELIERGSS